MNAFWNSLNHIALGQLFAHGHLSPATAAQLAARMAKPESRDDGGCKATPRKVVRWPRLAIPH